MKKWQRKVAGLNLAQKLKVAADLEKIASKIRVDAGIHSPEKTDAEISRPYRHKVEELLLEKIAKDLYPKGDKGKPWPVCATKILILACALAHWDKLETYYRADMNYGNAEDLNLLDLWAEKQRKHIFARKPKSRSK